MTQCIELGADEHLSKPCEPILLEARVKAALERRRLRDELNTLRAAVEQVGSAAEALGHRTYDPAVLSGLTWEDGSVGTLARAFDRMASAVRLRESRLEARLQQLRKDVRRGR
jgi:DNA-binding response OmpR family regulator